MEYSDNHYGKLLVGHKVSQDLLKGRGYRLDVKEYFKPFFEEAKGETIWYKTFSVGLDMVCQEAYFLFGLELDGEGRIVDVGTGVMYVTSSAGDGFFSFVSDDDVSWDVDDILPMANRYDEYDDDGYEDDEEDEDLDEDEDNDLDDEDDEDEDWEDAPSVKQVMDILPLSGMMAGNTPPWLNHEAAMILKGRWLPDGLSTKNLHFPTGLVDAFIHQEQDARQGYPILRELNLSMKANAAGDAFEGRLSTLSNRGQRYLVFNFYGSLQEGEARMSRYNVDSYLSTGSSHGNLFTRPRMLDEMPHDERQALLLLMDFYNDAEFADILKGAASNKA